MTLTGDQLGAFAGIATAIGLVRDGTPNPAWFTDPIGDPGNDGAAFQPGLRTMLADDTQRDALVAFVDEVLGSPDRETLDDEIWVPLFAEADPAVTIYAVLTPRPGSVRLGAGIEYEAGAGTPRVATRAHVPLFQMERRGGSLELSDPATPDWLLIGGPNGTITITVEAVLEEALPAPGDPALGGVSLTLGLPTSPDGEVTFALGLERLQLPGAEAPRDFTLRVDDLDQLGPELLDLLVGLVRAQADALDLADPSLRPFAALTGLLGIRAVPGIPPLPLAELTTSGVDTIVTWIGDVLAAGGPRDAWLGQLAALLGGTADPANDAVRFTIGPTDVLVGLRVEPGVSGLPVLVPRVEIGTETGGGARGRVELTADVLRIDTGTGDVTALPALRAEAVLGAEAGGPALLTGDPAVGSLRVGIALLDGTRPTFTLTLHDVVLNGRDHPLVDLSSPEAAVDAANDLIDDAIVAALDGLGPAGALLAQIIGLAPPAGVAGTDATALLAEPLAALAGYWNDLVVTSDAMRTVLDRVQQLVTGTTVAQVPGTGSGIDPWTIDLGGPVEIRAWIDGGQLRTALAVATSVPVLGDHQVVTALRLDVAHLRLADLTVDFVTGASGTMTLGRNDGEPLTASLSDLSIAADHLQLGVSWRADNGVGLVIEAPGLTLSTPPTEQLAPIDVAIPLPTIDAGGNVVFEPDWDDIEQALVALLDRVGSPAASALIDLAGWRDGGPRLALSALMDDPGTAVSAWLADLVLDCGRVRAALEPVAALLSGFGSGLVGIGTIERPFRAPIGGEPRAPGPAVWLDPGCPPPVGPVAFGTGRLRSTEPIEPADVAEVLRRGGETLFDVGDLLVGRDGLGEGLALLRDRWAGTDGLVAPPLTLPEGVTAVVIDDASYHELVAEGSSGALVFEAFDPVPSAVVHVGCEASWLVERPAGTAFDTVAGTTATVPTAGDGTWFVRLPEPVAAAEARPDRGAVAEQAARLAAVLAGRSDPIAVVAYGGAGAAALRVARDLAAVDRLATVGVPWGPLSVEATATGLGGDALRLLDLLRAQLPSGDLPDVADLEADPGRRVSRLVESSVDGLDPARRPVDATTEALRPGLAVTAVFGSLAGDDLELGIANAVADGLDLRLDAAAEIEGPETALHAGVAIPPLDLDLGGLLVGAGATVQLVTVSRDTGGGFAVGFDRRLVIEIRLGVHDGWLVGGPGASQHDLELRWLSALVEVPLVADGTVGTVDPGRTTLVLHEVTALGVSRERWVVGPGEVGAGDAVTRVLPEVRAVLSQVAIRLGTEAPAVAETLTQLGLLRDGGLDPAGLDRWVHDTADAASEAVAERLDALVVSLRALVGDTTGTGSSLVWAAGPTELRLDLATGAVTGTAAVSAEGARPAIDVSVTASPAGADVNASLGALDPDRGGLRLVLAAGTSSPPTVAAEIAPPGSAPTTVSLFPIADPAGLAGAAAALVPAAFASRVVDDLRNRVAGDGAPRLEATLDLLGLLGEAEPGGVRPTTVPFGLFLDPVAWLGHGVGAWRTALGPTAVTLLDAIGHVVTPGATGPSGRWPLTAELAVSYEAVGPRLRLRAAYTGSTTTGASTVTTDLGGGLDLALDAPPSPVVTASVAVNGHGVRLAVDPAAAPAVRLDLVRPAPRPALHLFPAGAGIGDIVTAAGGMVAPVVLNALIGHRDDPGASLLIDSARVAFDLGAALDLLEADQFTATRIEAFAADPAAALVARLPQVAASGVARLAAALDPGGALVVGSTPAPGQTRLAFGASGSVAVLLDGTTPAVELSADVAVPGVGRIVVAPIRLSATGVQVVARLGPAEVAVGPVTLFPMVTVQAGVATAGFTRSAGVGVAVDATAASSVEVRWGLDASPPELLLVSRTGLVETPLDDPVAAGLQLLGSVASLAAGILVDELQPLLSSQVRDWLQGVVFTDQAASVTVDPSLFADLLEPAALLDRLFRFGWNLATVSPPSITIDGTVTIGLSATGPTNDRRLGLNLTLPPNTRFPFTDSDLVVELEVEAGWIDPTKPPGLTIELLRGTRTNLRFEPGVIVGGVGIRISESSGPALDVGGVAIDAIAVHIYAEADAAGDLGGGVEIQLDGFAFSPAAGGGDNAVANSLLNDAGEAGAANRPAFSPALSVQKHPGPGGPSIGFRAGDPPGPWWVVVQRQLGPIYLEQVGLDTVESGGAVTRISLLFDGRVSLFGLEAAVEQLSLNWHGGDPLSITSWSVDLKGLAISADLSGAYLAGGLLKTEFDGQIGYVGMLLGRFGVYGLSVFGGYTDDDGSPSFFVFGAFNGPIGGPPAFFLTGIGGGLGINRLLRVPDDLSQFGEYPFIKSLDPAASPSGDVMGELEALNLYFPPERGNFWFAAGISFTSFALIDGVAVVAVSFGNGFEINLLGLARLALPRPQAALVSIELGLLVRFSTSEGVFLMQAQLTDNSWLLYEQVRLTGGFAMAMWWKGALAGQFVVSLGGYHPSFHRDGYPVVPRLGLEWRVTDEIVVKGGSYFALTSEALMAGVDVELSANFGWAWVRVAFGAHAIVFFDPFYYEAEAYARISAGIRIKIWFATISISISIGARIVVEGPDFAGRATFEIGPCELSVGFGSSRKERTPPLEWPDFVAKYLEEAGGDRARAISGITGRGSLPAATDGAVGVPSPDGTQAHPFEVFAEFEVSFVTAVPATAFIVGDTRVDLTPTLSNNSSTSLGIAPMGVELVTPTVTIGLKVKNGASFEDVPAAKLNALAAGLHLATGEEATAHVRADSFPLGVWGPPEDEQNKPMPAGEVVRAGNQIKLVAGFSTATAGPEIDYRQVKAGRRPLPLLAAAAERTALLTVAGTVQVDQPATAEAAVGAARNLLFAGAAAGTGDGGSGVAGVLPRGAHSVTAATAFAGDRAAPPRFGTLAGGIRAANGPRAGTGRQTPPTPPPGRRPRPPTVVGLLAAGSGVLAPPVPTTVGDRRIKRRVAPSVDSVRTRLGDELPIRLDRATTAPIALDGTLVIGSYPRTDLAGAAASHIGSRLGSPHLDALVGGIDEGRSGLLSAPVAEGDGKAAVRSGDLVVLEQVDATIDVAGDRPKLRIDGAARVVMVRAAGAVAVDEEVRDRAIEVPARARLVAIQADGQLDVTDGVSGWHDRSRLGRIGVGTAIGAGCTVRADGSDSRRRTGWATGRDALAGARRVTTRFARSANWVALVLDGVAAIEEIPMGVELRGCRRAVDVGGAERAPSVVLAGGQSIVLMPIEVEGQAAGFEIVVHAGGDWHLGGVLAGRGSIDDAAERVGRDGVDAVVANLLAVAGPGCRITWEYGSSPSGGGRRPTTPKRPAKKKPAKKRPAAKKKKAAAEKKPAKKKKAAKKKAAAEKKPAKKKKAAKKKPVTKKQPAAKKKAAKATRRRRTGSARREGER